MGLNDFVSLFYGSAQSLHTSSSSSVVAATTAADGVPNSEFKKTKTLEMLKNHKNSKLPKLNEFSSDKKFSRNMTLTSMKTPQQKGIRCGGIGIVNCDGMSKSGSGDIGGGVGGGIGVTKNVSDKKYKTLGKSSQHTPSTNANANAPAIAAASTAPPPASVSGSTSSTASAAVLAKSCSGSEMDLFKAPGGLRKKSSFLWNSFRMPRKQKGGESREMKMR